jgi:hypothetical protein
MNKMIVERHGFTMPIGDSAVVAEKQFRRFSFQIIRRKHMKNLIKFSIFVGFAVLLFSCGRSAPNESDSDNQREIAASQNANKVTQQRQSQEGEPRQPDTRPMYPGCQDKPANEQNACSQRKMMRALQKVIKYPAKAVEDNVNGIVVHSFVIEADGTMSNLELTQSLTPECDAAAYHAIVALMEESGPWVPGTLDGKNMAVRYSLPIQFGK